MQPTGHPLSALEPTEPVGRLCAAWLGADSVRLAPLAGGGFSGSAVQLVEHVATGRKFVLKRFPESTPPDRCAWVHALMKHLRAAGIAAVPEVIDRRHAAAGASPTIVGDGEGGCWELVAFMPGRSTDRPTPGQAARALETLATLHVAAAGLSAAAASGPSPGVVRRREQARHLLALPWRQRRAAIGMDADAAVLARFDEAIDVFDRAGGTRALERIAATEAGPLALQPVLRDIWSDHVLFAAEGERVSGIVDYHAAGIDSPATDLARLLGSWTLAGERRAMSLVDAWQDAIAAYERVRPLVPGERRLVPWLHATGVIFGLDNWFRWTLEERRTFSDAARMHERIARLVAALGSAFACQ
jgi:Ser/Thr protein kinase RdoA (MazF antagonist)